MAAIIEPAPSGRAKCRGCGSKIEKGELRLGEQLPNPFAEQGTMTLWFHLQCGAYKRPEVLLEALESTAPAPEGGERLRTDAQQGIDHRRLPRVDGVQRAPTGRARCRSCREAIAKGDWRIPLVFYDQGRFEPGGFVHLRCSEAYFGTTRLIERMTHFASDLAEEEVEELRRALPASS